MRSDLLHPVYVFAGIGICMIAAALLAYIVPFYRRDLKSESAARLTSLDGLRGLLCFAVMYCHAAITYNYLDTGVWSAPPTNFHKLLGSTSVALFFCITGFLFWSRALAVSGRIDALPFLRARFFRVAPLYTFSCFAAIALASARIHWGLPTTVRGLLSMGMMGLRPWPAQGNVNISLVDAGVTWTLPFEWGFYFALPALALGAVTDGWRKLVLMAGAVYILFGIGPHVYFVSGILAAYVSSRPEIVSVLKRRRIGVGVLILLLGMLLVTGNGIKAFVLTTLAFVPIACGNDLLGLLNLKGLRLMGVVSYSVYLLHGIVLYAARPLLLNVKGAAGVEAAHYWMTIYALSLIVLLVSMFTYRYIEWSCIMLEKSAIMRHCLHQRQIKTVIVLSSGHSLSTAYLV